MARARAFNLTAELNLRGPANIGNIVSNIRRQLGNINANVNVVVSANSTRNVTQLNTALRTLNTTLATTTTSVNAATTAFNRFNQTLTQFNRSFNPQQINNASRSMNNLGRSTTVATTQMQEFGRQSALAVRRFAAFSTVTSVIFGLTNAIRNGVTAFIDYDKELVKLQQVTGESAAGLKGLSSTITELATKFGISSGELTSVSSTLAQAGLTARDTEKALKALALSSLAPSFDDMNQTVEGSIALMRQFNISAGDLEKSLGAVNSVAARFAVESSDIITAIQRTGGVFATASRGVSEGTDALNEFIAVFTSIRATTRESAETIATGLRTIFTRIQRESTVDALKQLGINLRDVEGKFVGPYEAIRRLSEGLSKIDPRSAEFAKISEELGGFRQIGKVIPLIQQFATAQEALKVAQTGQGSLTRDAVTAQLSLANQIAKVREEFLALFRDIGRSDSFQTIARGALDLTSNLIKMADSIKGVLPVLTAMLAFRGAGALVQFGAGFAGGIRGGAGATRRNVGGYAFAGGGLVPGTGDSDTVGAALTPGEYVIRKKAVQAIGIDNLHALNRHADGGFIRKYKKAGRVDPLNEGEIRRMEYLQSSPSRLSSTKQAELAVLMKRQSQSQKYASASSKLSITDNEIPTMRFGLAALYGNPYSGSKGRPYNTITPKSQVPIALYSGSLDKKTVSDEFENFTLGEFKNTIGRTATKLSDLLQSTVDINPGKLDGVIKNVGIGNIIGPILESTIGLISAPFITRTKQNKSIDFPLGIGAIADKFGIPTGIPTDATRTISGGSSKTVVGFTDQIDRYLLANGYSDRSKSEDTKQSSKNKKNLGGIIQKFAKGGLAQVPLIDDIDNATGTIMPRPSSAIAALISAGRGAIDIDRTIKRTIGDKAYGMAKTSGQQSAALDKFFRDPQARLRDVTSAPLTAFGKELQAAIKSGQLQPGRLSIISKSQRVPGVAEYLSGLFGIPLANMIFTGGGSKQPAMDALRNKGPRADRISRFAAGGGVGEDTVAALLTPGEFVINKNAASRLGSSTLNKLNNADKLPGFNKGGSVGGVQHFVTGGNVEAQAARSLNASNIQGFARFFGSLDSQLNLTGRQIQQLGRSLTRSGIQLTEWSALVARGGNITLQQAQRAIQADINRTRATDTSVNAVNRLTRAENILNRTREVGTTATNRYRERQQAAANMSTMGRLGNFMGGQGGMFLSLGVGALAGQGENLFGKPKTKEAAGMVGGFESAATTAATGLGVASSVAMIPGIGPFIAALVLAATVVTTFTSYFSGSDEAIKEFSQNLRNKNIENASDRTAKALTALEQNITNTSLQFEANRAIIEESDLRQKDLNAQINNVNNRLRTWSEFFSGTESTNKRGEKQTLTEESISKNKALADQAQKRIEMMIRSGQSSSQIQSDPAFLNLVRTIARTDATFLALERTGNELEIKQNLLRRGSELLNNTTSQGIRAAADQEKRMAELSRVTQRVSMSLDKFAQALSNAINKTTFELESLNNASELSAQALTGEARVGTSASRNINILENPLAYSASERQGAVRAGASLLSGNNAQIQQAITTLPDRLESAFISTASSLPAGLSPEQRQSEISKTGAGIIQSLPGLSQELKDNLQRQLDLQIKELSDSIQKQIDNGLSATDATAMFNDGLRRLARESISSSEAFQKNTIALLQARDSIINQFIDSLNKNSQRLDNISNIRQKIEQTTINAFVELRKAISGVELSFEEATNIQQQRVSGFTGGTTDPQQIRANIVRLEQQRREQQAALDAERQKEKPNTDEIVRLGAAVQDTTRQLNNNNAALKDLAENTMRADAAMGKIQRIISALDARKQYVEKLITSSRTERIEIGNTLARLNNNLRGGLNLTSVGANRAYSTTLAETGDRSEALKAADEVRARERGEVLSTFKELRGLFIHNLQQQVNPQTGQRFTEAEAIQRANEQEAMLMTQQATEAGVINNPLVREQIEATRTGNRNDQLLEKAQKDYLNATRLQTEAMIQQMEIEQSLILSLNQLSDALNSNMARLSVAAGAAATGQTQQLEAGGTGGTGGTVRFVDPRTGEITSAPSTGMTPIRRAFGGLINFSPKGTDTVPAMLTEGEFVVNRESTQANLPLLHSINNARGHSSGGVVYLRGGGRVSGREMTLQRNREEAGLLPQFQIGAMPTGFIPEELPPGIKPEVAKKRMPLQYWRSPQGIQELTDLALSNPAQAVRIQNMLDRAAMADARKAQTNEQRRINRERYFAPGAADRRKQSMQGPSENYSRVRAEMAQREENAEIRQGARVARKLGWSINPDTGFPNPIDIYEEAKLSESERKALRKYEDQEVTRFGQERDKALADRVQKKMDAERKQRDVEWEQKESERKAKEAGMEARRQESRSRVSKEVAAEREVERRKEAEIASKRKEENELWDKSVGSVSAKERERDIANRKAKKAERDKPENIIAAIKNKIASIIGDFSEPRTGIKFTDAELYDFAIAEIENIGIPQEDDPVAIKEAAVRSIRRSIGQLESRQFDARQQTYAQKEEYLSVPNRINRIGKVIGAGIMGIPNVAAHGDINEKARAARSQAYESYKKSTNPIDAGASLLFGVGLGYLGEGFSHAGLAISELASFGLLRGPRKPTMSKRPIQPTGRPSTTPPPAKRPTPVVSTPSPSKTPDNFIPSENLADAAASLKAKSAVDEAVQNILSRGSPAIPRKPPTPLFPSNLPNKLAEEHSMEQLVTVSNMFKRSGDTTKLRLLEQAIERRGVLDRAGQARMNLPSIDFSIPGATAQTTTQSLSELPDQTLFDYLKQSGSSTRQEIFQAVQEEIARRRRFIELFSGVTPESVTAVERQRLGLAPVVDFSIPKAAGGLIGFSPRGSDKVPAMLTEGEFVINRESAQKNLGLLHSINRNRGGIVPKYYYQGGEAVGEYGAVAPAPSASPLTAGNSMEVPTDLGKFLSQFTKSIDTFGKNIQKLSDLKPLKIEGTFKHDGKVEVVITGAAALDMFEQTIQKKIDKSISDAVNDLKLDPVGNIIRNVGSPTVTETGK